MRFIDPVKFCELCWPSITLYDKQVEIMRSVRDNDETIVVAGNDLGKDFIAGLTALWFFVSRRPAKVVTTSVQGGQLSDVLWGEIRRFLDTTRCPLPIQYNHLHLRHLRKDGSFEPRSEMTGQVVNQGESLLGRHLERTGVDDPRTLLILDESSGIDDTVYNSGATWAHRILAIGNPFPCENYFKRGFRQGDIRRPSGVGYYRKIIHIRAEDSPNVRLAMEEIARGEEPSLKILVPGVLDYAEYLKRRNTWDRVRQCISLDGQFYEGAEVLLYPPDWLNAAERRADLRRGKTGRCTMGVDSAAGGDNTAWAVCDELGLLELESFKTSDTSVILGRTIAMAQRFGVTADNIFFDAGGGGKQHADYLRVRGWRVRTVAFGESVNPPIRSGIATVNQRRQTVEEHYTYKNRRAQMYGMLRVRLDPSQDATFCIPARFAELRRQLALMPLRYDAEGRLYMLPKQKRTPLSTEQTLTELLGCSPDEADALVLAVYGQSARAATPVFAIA